MKSIAVLLFSLGLSHIQLCAGGAARGALDAITKIQDARRRRLATAPVDVLFIIDESDSMSEEQNDVRRRVKEIFNQLPPGSAVGLVGYGRQSSIFAPRPGAPQVHTPLTTDSEQFQDAADELEATGTYEPAYLALYQSVADDFSVPLGFRGNKFCSILITDESSNGSGVTQTQTIDALKGATNSGLESVFFGITVDGSVRRPYERIASSTGGAIFRLEDFRRDPSFVLTPVLEACTVAVLDNMLLDPAMDTKILGESHTVSASVLKIVDESVIDEGVINDGVLDPQSGVLVTFEVVRGPNTGTTGFCTADSRCMTDDAGQLSFTYVGDGGVGVDEIQACFTDSVLGTNKCTTVSAEWLNAPTSAPSSGPTFAPSIPPSAAPTSSPTRKPSMQPMLPPSVKPTFVPSETPTLPPSDEPSTKPSASPSAAPTVRPTVVPSKNPSTEPTMTPIFDPSSGPSAAPTSEPSAGPTFAPSVEPTTTPSVEPTIAPSIAPTTSPSVSPSSMPSGMPSSMPSLRPSVMPSRVPTASPSCMPTTVAPSMMPTNGPFASPSNVPSISPSWSPTAQPSVTPSFIPSAVPSKAPSASPSSKQTAAPSTSPSVAPSLNPSSVPTTLPTSSPSENPTPLPTIWPTTTEPSSNPTTVSPTSNPTDIFCPLEKDKRFVLDEVEFPGDTRSCKWLQKPVGDRLSIYCNDPQSSALQDCPLTCGRCDPAVDPACEDEERTATFLRDINGSQERNPAIGTDDYDPALINVRRCKWLVKGQDRLDQFCPRSTSTAAAVCPCNCAFLDSLIP